MKQPGCEKCFLRAKYDRNPGSLIGRFWKWHTGFCPGWKSYIRSRTPEEREKLFADYGRIKI